MTEPEASHDVPPVEPASPRKAVFLALLIAACVAIVYLTPIREYVAPLKHLERPPWIDELRAKADEAGLLGQVLFVAGCALGVSVGVPRLALAFVGGAVFGWIEGTILAQLGTFAGCWATFVVGRNLGHAWVQGLVSRRFPRAKALLDFISRHGFEANVILRLTPVGNAFATNLLFAVSTVSLGTFLTATFIGTFPETAVMALLGSAAKGTEMAPRLLGGAIALVVIGVGAAWWTKRLRARGTNPS
ncbi:MAG: TVP38/TMEM64 family protein [Planctomycetes bacterium]|nr:TVP38/TMEM64 family protein [Planctomycetota bacterium]